jgi:hypothetical protein
MSDGVLVWLIVAGAIGAFAAMWFGITGLLGLVSGWKGLERAFPDHPEPPVETLSFQTGRMRGVNYNNCLRFELCATGLRVAVPRLLGPFQKPFFVPWGQIRSEPFSSPFMKLVSLTLGARGEGTILIRQRTFERIAVVGHLSLG